MANLVITNSNFTAGSTIVASQFNTNFSDISTYINNRNAGTTAWDGLLSPTATLSNTSLQLVLGTTTTTTLSATAPASSAVYTIPDIGTTGTFILSNSNSQGLFANGTNSLPSISFTSDLDTGIYRAGANDLGITVGGTLQVEISSTKVLFTALVGAGDGLVSTPAYTFGSDQDTGIYRIGANNLGISVGGTKAIDVKTTGVAILGSNTNDSAATGFVGEVIQSVSTSNTNYPSTATYGDLTSIDLTAGDWIVGAIVNCNPGDSNVSNVVSGISTSSGSSFGDIQTGSNVASIRIGTSSSGFGITTVIPVYHVQIASTTTYYLKYRANYTGTIPTGNGRITAVRIR